MSVHGIFMVIFNKVRWCFRWQEQSWQHYILLSQCLLSKWICRSSAKQLLITHMIIKIIPEHPNETQRHFVILQSNWKFKALWQCKLKGTPWKCSIKTRRHKTNVSHHCKIYKCVLSIIILHDHFVGLIFLQLHTNSVYSKCCFY